MGILNESCLYHYPDCKGSDLSRIRDFGGSSRMNWKSVQVKVGVLHSRYENEVPFQAST